MCEYYVTLDKCLVGEVAEIYHKNKLRYLNKLSDEVYSVLAQCKDINHEVTNKDIVSSVLEAGEKFSTIEILLENLLKDIHLNLVFGDQI